MQRDVLTALEAASTLNLHPETVKRFCRIGKLKGEKLSVGWRKGSNANYSSEQDGWPSFLAWSDI